MEPFVSLVAGVDLVIAIEFTRKFKLSFMYLFIEVDIT